MSSYGAEENEGNGDLDNKRSHHTELLEPHRQLMSEPGQRGRYTLGLIVIGQS